MNLIEATAVNSCNHGSPILAAISVVRGVPHMLPKVVTQELVNVREVKDYYPSIGINSQ